MGELEGRCSLPDLVRNRSTCGTPWGIDLGRKVVVVMGVVKMMVIMLGIGLFGKDSEVGGNDGGENNIDVDADENF